jgi:ATP-binding cassette subfamily B protein
VSGDRIAEVLFTDESIKDPSSPKVLPAQFASELKFNDVSFHYPGGDDDVLRHISFTAKPGQTTAIIGATGSGKSTLVNLAMRFYDVTAGAITLGGTDIRELRKNDLRGEIGYVPQRSILFTGTIKSNLSYADKNMSMDNIKKAAEIAQATEFIDTKPEGYDTLIAEGGANVSGGQKQRLSIARALAKNAPVYVFDDSFSALDLKTDAKLRSALSKVTSQSIVLLVTQRVSTIMNAEQIIVLDQGKVAGIGTHAELLKNCAVYDEIAHSQLSEEELAR